jgi:phenylacetate-CoA ligase
MVLPAFRRQLIEPLYFGANGSPRLKAWRELEQTQYLPEKVLRDRQWQRLTALLRDVYENNSFYRRRFKDAGLHPRDIKSASDVSLIPVLTKDEIRKSACDMITAGYSVESLLNFKTGGSTGKPLEIHITEECSEIRNACARRHDRWTGWEVGEAVGAVWGNPELPKDLKSKLKHWLLAPTIYLDTMRVSEDAVREFAGKWERVRPALMFGHAHSIYLLALYVRDLGILSISPRGIVTSSMMLIPHERETIEKVFGKIVFNRYGCEELSLIASECEKHDGMHINIDHLFVEFIKENGEPAKAGESGRIVVTDLINRAMPFIRYQVEDVGVPLDKKCSCGRGMPMMAEVAGRVADFLVKRDGTQVAGVSLIENTLTRIPGIEQMQIVQDTLELITLNVVEGKAFTEERKASLRAYFQNLFGNGVAVEINPVKEIMPEKSGKYRFSISKVRQE